MRFATKFLIGSVATAIAAASHPDGLLVAGIAFSIWFVINRKKVELLCLSRRLAGISEGLTVCDLRGNG